MVAVTMAEAGDDVHERARLLPPREEIAAHHLIDEQRLLDRLIERAVFSEDERRRSTDLARRLVHAARADRGKHAGVDAFMREYGLSSEEGVILMCIAEALLRIPDTETADELIAEKIAGGHWEKHRGQSDNLFVNASTWALMLTGRVVKLREARGANPVDALKRLVARSGEPVIRQAVRQAVKVLADQFVLGRNIREALVRAQDYEEKGYLFSYDMLGEAARTQKDADVYFERYLGAVDAIGQAAGPFSSMHSDALYGRPGLSVKLSALHPRFEAGKEERLASELAPRMLTLARAARSRGLTLTIDAEEQDRLDPTLEIFASTYTHPALDGWSGLGVAVQAYGKRAIPTLRWLRRLAERSGKRIPVRLVKGAYWDSEIKWAQERAFSDYPVFTRKLHTDVSFLACVRLMLSDPKAFYCAVRHAQCLCDCRGARRRWSGRVRVPAAARHGRAAARRGRRRKRPDQAAVPHLCAGRRSRRSARLSCAAPARERRQHLVHQSARRRRGAGVGDHPRSGGDGRSRTRRRRGAAAALCASARHLFARARGGERPGADGICGAPRAVHRDG